MKPPTKGARQSKGNMNKIKYSKSPTLSPKVARSISDQEIMREERTSEIQAKGVGGLGYQNGIGGQKKNH
jgi:hypothetical protein